MFDKVVNLIAQQLPIDKKAITMDSKLLEDLGADSANLMMLIMDVEQEFGIMVEDDALSTLVTVGDVVKYLEAHTK